MSEIQMVLILPLLVIGGICIGVLIENRRNHKAWKDGFDSCKKIYDPEKK